VYYALIITASAALKLTLIIVLSAKQTSGSRMITLVSLAGLALFDTQPQELVLPLAKPVTLAAGLVLLISSH
jgi:hypothetical protein